MAQTVDVERSRLRGHHLGLLLVMALSRFRVYILAVLPTFVKILQNHARGSRHSVRLFSVHALSWRGRVLGDSELEHTGPGKLEYAAPGELEHTAPCYETVLCLTAACQLLSLAARAISGAQHSLPACQPILRPRGRAQPTAGARPSQPRTSW